jgi:predicted TIM-barrel fold metal-dependent hydrolase
MMSAVPPSDVIIDVHAHATLDLGDGRDAGTNIPMGLVPAWSPAEALELMDQAGVGASLLSMPEAGVHADRALNRQRSRQVNEFLAALSRDHPARFGAMAVLPAQNIDDALAELAYALDVLAMDAVSLPTSVQDVYLGRSSARSRVQRSERSLRDTPDSCVSSIY